MKFEGTFTVKTDVKTVWNFLMDPNAIAHCLPDLQEMQVIDENRFNATIKAGVGFIKGIFKFQFSIADRNPPIHAKLIGHGTGTGSVIDMDTIFDLQEENGSTTMKWAADAKIGGMIAGVGSRLIESASAKTIKDLFDAIRKELEPGS